MSLSLGLLIFSFFVTSVLIVPYINLLYKLRFLRKKEGVKGKGAPSVFDKLHDWKAGTPVGGGILLVIIITLLFGLFFPLLSFLGVFITAAYDVKAEINILLFTFLSFAVLGLYDDFLKIFGKPKVGKLGMWSGLGGKQKFALQWILGFTVGIMLYQNLKIDLVHIPLFDVVVNLGIWYVPFAAFTVVSFANAYNITDGLDGLAAGLLTIALFSFWIISAKILDTPTSIFLALWIGALIAFLYFNVWPARIFLGDSGALSFGATLAVIGLISGKIFALVVIGGIFVLETATSLVQLAGWRLLNRPIFPIAPAHHWLELRGWEEPKIVMRAWLAGLMLGIFGLWLAII